MDESTTEPEIVILPDAESVARVAATLIVASAEAAWSDEFSIALAGGDTPGLLYEILATEPYVSRIRWDRWRVWWGDERAVGPDAPESNYALARERLLQYVPISPDRVHRIPGEKGAAVAARAYDTEMHRHFGARLPLMDVVLLGIGEDGHIASLFPGSQALEEKNLAVVHSLAAHPPRERVTLTLPAINAARRVVFIVTGRNKAHALRAVIAADQEDAQQPPAALVRPENGYVHFIVDEAAGLFLTGVPARESPRTAHT